MYERIAAGVSNRGGNPAYAFSAVVVVFIQKTQYAKVAPVLFESIVVPVDVYAMKLWVFLKRR